MIKRGRWRETGREERARSERGKKGVKERRSGKEREKREIA